MSEETIQLGEVSIPKTKVWMLNINGGEHAAAFTDSLSQFVAIDKLKDWDLYQGKLGWISTVNVTASRNNVVKKFLETDGEWAWLVDSDMVFPPEALFRLLLSAQRVDAKIIGGLCVGVDPNRGPRPTIYEYNDATPEGVCRVHYDYKEDTLMQVLATGAAFLLVHREVFETMRDHAIQNQRWMNQNSSNEIVQYMMKNDMFKEPHPDYAWFNETVRRARWVSEDIEFCLKANALGYGVWVDTTVQIGHYKDRRTWMPSDIKEGRGFAPLKTVAVVPVKDKLHLTTDIVHQLRQQKCHEIIICDNGSGPETKSWLASQDDITVMDCPDVGIHHMWNQAINYSLEKYGHRCHIAFLNNDLRLEDDCLKNLSRELSEHTDYAAVSANYDNRVLTDGTLQEVNDICAGRYDGTGGLAGFAFMVSGAFFSNDYRFPEQCKWWYGDNDLIQVINMTQWKAGIALLAKVEHLDGGSNTGNWTSPEMQEQIKADEKAFKERWNQWRLAQQAKERQANHQCPEDFKPLEVATDRLPFICDLEASANSFPRQWSDDVPYMVKIKEDVERYQKLIEQTQPEVVIECGTWDGGSAEWFASLGLEVITIDIEDHVPSERKAKLNGQVHWLAGSSVDAGIVDKVKEIVGDRRCMVSLDSDHHACHVLTEMELYAPITSPGCYMVVEDGLVRYVPGQDIQTIITHGPLEAIEHYLGTHKDFERDEVIEKMHPATMHPAGWLRKVS